ncbi:acyl-CoA dehydrogenase family protein [Streptomyces sp. WMMC905]|uniref:acyl-CoA dehydrogenase family protein n=1 Tax=Streptomyces sp. WMMC905 TaxID=3404123 RepID=UPI003B949A3F
MRASRERRELGEAVRALLTRHRGDAAWRPLTEEVGAAGLAVPEEYGGVGGGARDVHVVMEELGRVLSPVPYLGSAVLTTQALTASGDRHARALLLPLLASGRSVGALAWAEAGSWDPAAVRTDARPRPGGEWRLTGTKEHVLHGVEADVLLVAARTSAGVSLFRVTPTRPGVRREATPSLDDTRAQARISLDGAPGRLVGEDGAGDDVLRHLLDRGCAALAAEQVGAAERCLEMTVDHTLRRVQFGRPLAAFQAVKHRLADAYVLVEAARSAALGAAWALDEGSPESRRRVAAAKSVCSEAFAAVAGETIQLHGALGVTWEHDAHRYFKRAHGSGWLLGSPDRHRRRLASELGLPVPDA